MQTAEELVTSVLDWLRGNYRRFRFHVERDVVWTLQTHLREATESERLPYRVHNDYPILPGNRRSLSADLAIVDGAGRVLLARELKYEPSHQRDDILRHKFPVVFWGADGVGGDVLRIRRFVTEGRAARAMSVFVDEGRAFRHREPHEGSASVAWANGVWTLVASAERTGGA